MQPVPRSWASTAPAGRGRRRVAVLAAAVGLLVLAACGSDTTGEGSSSDSTGPARRTVRVLTHDSFAVSDDVLEAFEAGSGIDVEIVAAGDAVQVVNEAVLTAGDPQADVLFGIDNNTLTRAFDADLFVPYESPGLAGVPEDLQLDPDHRVTPIDVGDVCVNYDRVWFAERGIDPPGGLEDLTDPTYRDLLAVQNPSTSTPGLAFLLATVAHAGEDGWQDYWEALGDNGVAVADGWETAYNDLFSANGRSGDRPLVVSYASIPPFEVADPASTPAEEAPSGVAAETCYRQIEFAGILRGTDDEAAAGEVIDFLLSRSFQEDVPLQMYVYPASAQATLPEIFTTYAVPIDDPYLLDPELVGEKSSTWVEEWVRMGIG